MGRFRWIGRRESVGLYYRVVYIGLPVVIGSDEIAGRVIYAENRIREHIGKPEAAERWPQRAKHHALGVGPGNDKATNQSGVTARNEPPSREVERLRPHCGELRIFQMNGNGVVCSVTPHGPILIIENLFASGVQAEELSERRNVGTPPLTNA